MERRLWPGDLARLTAIGLDERAAVAWVDALQDGTDDRIDDQAVAFVAAWRKAGLPGNPPPGAARYRHRDLAELRAWLEAGFDLYAADRLKWAGLDRAVEWRTAGFSVADTYELLRRDPALTPSEALAFDNPAVRDRRRDWIYLGFDAAEAAAWTALGIGPEQARLWRSRGEGPADAAPGQVLPPDMTAGRAYFGRAAIGSPDGPVIYPQEDDRDDPPGTRGRRARRRAHDDDPWINED